MKISVVSVIVFVGGFIMVYAGIKDLDPRDVVKAALRGENPGDLTPKTHPSSTGATGGVVQLPNAKGTRKNAVKGNTDSPEPADLTPGNGDTVRA